MRVYHSREIGKILNVSYQTVCNYCNKINLTLPLSGEELEELKQMYSNYKKKLEKK